jgi:serine/threonine-protein kinase
MPPVPKSIGRYEIIGLVGRGGMGVLYRARDPMLERDVAVKMMHVDFTLDTAARARFEREAKAVARLQHRNVVTLHELGEVDGTPYIVMEFLGGKDLDAILRGSKPLALGEKLDIVAQLCEGLGYAHDQGIVHRDVKPGNVRVLEDGTVKILDFGIARFASTAVTQSGTIMGTPSYMSPEQIMGKAVDGRADLFSAGVLLYELLSGKKPFSGDSPTAVAYQIMHTEAVPVRTEAPELPEALAEIVARSLQKNPDDRYNRASEMSADLQTVRMVLDPPLQALETSRATGPAAMTLGKLHATALRNRTSETPTTALEAPMRATVEDEAAAAAGRTSAQSRSGRGVMLAVAGVVLLAGAIGTYFAIQSRSGKTGGEGTNVEAGGAGPASGGGAGGGQPGSQQGGGATPLGETLEITSQPAGAAIAVNGADTGQVTPATVTIGRLPAQVQLSLRGYQPVTASLTEAEMRAGRRDWRLSRELIPVRAVITGSYPFEIVQGSRVLSAAKTEHSLTIQPGGEVIARSQEMFLRATLPIDFRKAQVQHEIPAASTLTVQAANETCKVVIDGTDLGTPPIRNKRIASGTHTVVLKCPDGRDERESLALEPGQPKRHFFPGGR